MLKGDTRGGQVITKQKRTHLLVMLVKAARDNDLGKHRDVRSLCRAVRNAATSRRESPVITRPDATKAMDDLNLWYR